ncbi:MAG TPA: hypothetical protein VKZ53_10370 [Candidatus Angelobacter sp.]|nr:hypothetical protein [Candidatus Angelobacter sp.]
MASHGTEEKLVREVLLDKDLLPQSGLDSLLDPDPLREENPKAHATERRCKAVVINNFDKRGITNITLRHRYRNDPNRGQQRTYDRLGFGEITSLPLDVIYFTGPGTGRDYWFVEFLDSAGQRWQCKPNFYCILRTEDEGTTVQSVLNGSTEEMSLIIVSGNCRVSLSKQ